MNKPSLEQFLQSPLGQTVTQHSLNEELMAQSHWQGRYRILMKLGSRIEALPQDLQQREAEVLGCESATWLYHTEHQGKHYFLADSEARIVQGVLVLVLACCNGRSREELAQVDLTPWFAELGLSSHLSPSRSNGLNAVVQKIAQIAES